MNICVFCGSSKGTTPVYIEAAKNLGKLLAEKKITLVYGGGNVGLMGVIADAVIEHEGKVIGIIPEFLMRREVGHRGITQLEVVQSMHERKKRMADLADGFIAMPGGWGTLEELAEILTWRQLTLIDQPVGILNTAGFFDPLLQQMHKMTDEGFLKHGWLDTLHVAETPSQLLEYFV
jgi:uncharacterized protein (TIGR00730 family)